MQKNAFCFPVMGQEYSCDAIEIMIFISTFLGRSQDYFKGTRGERAEVVKHRDNLTLEGAHSMEKTQELVVRGERATIEKHEDNLKVRTNE